MMPEMMTVTTLPDTPLLGPIEEEETEPEVKTGRTGLCCVCVDGSGD